jgi:hypothetical protein
VGFVNSGSDGSNVGFFNTDSGGGNNIGFFNSGYG